MAAEQHIIPFARDQTAMEVWVRCQAIPCEICGEESGTETGFDPNTSVSEPLSFHQRSTLIHSSATDAENLKP